MTRPSPVAIVASSSTLRGLQRRAPGVRRFTAGLLAGGMLLLGAVFGIGMPQTSAVAAEQAETISQGTVTWGIKESWRKYMGGGELSGGVTATPSGAYAWPVESGSYDAASHSLTLELAGSAHYRGYCDDSGFCQLDSTFEDLTLEISPDRQVIRGTYVGRPQNNPGGELQRYENGVLAELNIYDVEPGVADGVTNWSGIPATAGDGMILYSGGVAVDPVSISYTGPGGKPDLAERWDTPGAPVYTADAEWTPEAHGFGEQPAVYASEAGDRLIATEFLGVSNGSARLRFVALDAGTLEVLGSREIEAGTSTETQTAFDPETGTVFFMEHAATEAHIRISLHAATWNPESSSFDVAEVTSISEPRAAGVAPPKAGGVLAWNRTTAQLLWTTLANQPGATDTRTNIALHTIVRTAAGWDETTTEFVLPADVLDDALGDDAATFLVQQNRSERSSVSLADGSMLFAFGGTYYSAEGEEFKRPITRIAPLQDGRWSVAYLPDTVAPDTTGYDVGPSAYTAISRAADGGVMAFGSDWSGTLGYLPGDDAAAPMQHVDPYPDAFTYAAMNAAADPLHGFDLALDPFQKNVAVMRDHQLLAEFSVPVNQRASTFLVAGDGALIAAVEGAGNGPQPIRRFALTATAPEITAQPQPTTIGLTQGALTGAAELTVAASDDAQVQWQRKLPGQQRFTSVDGATARTFAPELSIEQSGAEFRAIASNTAGRVVSESAAVTVESAPRFAQQPASLSVYDGDTAVFTAPIAPGIAGDQRWERLVDGQWVGVATDDAHTVDGATLSVHASPAVDGQQFRSVLSNRVGENASGVATLTVVPRGTIPEGGLTYTGVGLEWDGNAELQHLAPTRAANYFSAGVSDGTAATYLGSAGNVKILHETDGQRLEASYGNRDAFVAAGGRQLVRLANGVARVQADGSAVVQWEGSWSVNMYGGLVPFTISDPVLTVAADGTGTLTGDLSGYAGDMSKPDEKTPLEPVAGATIATFAGVTLDTLNADTVTPDYRGVEIDIPEGVAAAQSRSGADWGAWPQSFVDFQLATGLSSYWYSSGGSADANKVARPFTVDFSTATAEEVEVPDAAPQITQHPQSLTATVGERATFTAAASGEPAPTVQWQVRRAAVPAPGAARVSALAADAMEWTDIDGATDAVLTTPELTADDAVAIMEYRAVFSNRAGSAASHAATLAVQPAEGPGADADADADGASGAGGATGAAGAADGSGTAGAAGAGTASGAEASGGGSASGAPGALRSGAGADLAETGAPHLLGLWIAAAAALVCGAGALLLARRGVAIRGEDAARGA